MHAEMSALEALIAEVDSHVAMLEAEQERLEALTQEASRREGRYCTITANPDGSVGSIVLTAAAEKKAVTEVITDVNETWDGLQHGLQELASGFAVGSGEGDR